jgi:hypothetical protein
VQAGGTAPAIFRGQWPALHMEGWEIDGEVRRRLLASPLAFLCSCRLRSPSRTSDDCFQETLDLSPQLMCYLDISVHSFRAELTQSQRFHSGICQDGLFGRSFSYHFGEAESFIYLLFIRSSVTPSHAFLLRTVPVVNVSTHFFAPFLHRWEVRPPLDWPQWFTICVRWRLIFL